MTQAVFYKPRLSGGNSRRTILKRPWSVRQFVARCALREVIGIAFWTMAERLNQAVLVRDRLDRSGCVARMGVGERRDHRERSHEHVDQPAAPLRCPPRHLPDVAALGAGPRIFLRLPWEPHGMIVAARRCRVKRLPRFAARPPDRCRVLPWSSRPGARCQDYSWPVSPDHSPNHRGRTKIPVRAGTRSGATTYTHS